ncbi:MAG TPA: carboxypeptidase-like regulatory domain-containing protein [Bacteroidia bacterium]|nr:carboxypeptidase-like regulatory domain-containing protein [Bacteroidia bacterium]
MIFRKKTYLLVFSVEFLVLSFMYSQKMVQGIVCDEDSTKVLPFVYVINKNTSFGTVSDINGKFSVKAGESDTLVFSYLGYIKQYIPVSFLPKINYKIIMKKNVYSLKPVNVSVLKYQNYEKDYMKRVIEKSQMPTIDIIQSPITALYMQFSKKGREMQRLSKIFEEIFIKEQVEKKINPQILYQLTGDPNVDIEALRKFCGFFLSDYFILNNDGYDLYSRVLECYYRYKFEKEH